MKHPIENIVYFWLEFNYKLMFKEQMHIHVMSGIKDEGCEDKIVVINNDSKLHEIAIKNKVAFNSDYTEGFSDEVLKLAKKQP